MATVTPLVCTTCDDPNIISFVVEIRDTSDVVLETITEATATAATPGVTVTQVPGSVSEIDIDQAVITQDTRVCFVSYTTSCGQADINECADIPQEASAESIQRCINGAADLGTSAGVRTSGTTILHDDGYIYRSGSFMSDGDGVNDQQGGIVNTDTFALGTERSDTYTVPTRLPWFYNNEPNTTFSKIQDSEYQSLALADDGRLFLWGHPTAGLQNPTFQTFYEWQGLKNNATFNLETALTPRVVPFPVGVTAWVDFSNSPSYWSMTNGVSTIGNHTYLIGDDGNTYSFGIQPSEGAMGQGSTAWTGANPAGAVRRDQPTLANRLTPAPDAAPNSIWVGTRDQVVYNSGGVTYFYRNGVDPPQAIAMGGATATKVVSGNGVEGMHILASDGTVWYIGGGQDAHAGVGSTLFNLPAAQIAFPVPVVDIARSGTGGSAKGFAVGSDGNFYWWGQTQTPITNTNNGPPINMNFYAPYQKVWANNDGIIILQDTGSDFWVINSGGNGSNSMTPQALSASTMDRTVEGILGYNPVTTLNAGFPGGNTLPGGPWPACTPPGFFATS